MVKKLLTFFFGICLMAGAATAQTESTIAAGDIVYWVGEGEDQAILAIDFGTTALAWGYRFDESDGLTVDDMINDIMDADPRAQLSMDWDTYEDCFYYVERPQYDLTCTGFGFKVNGTLADEDDAFDDYDLENGMFVKVSASAAAVWSTAIVPVTVKHMPVDATIDASEVTYWVGEGANSAVIAFNWGSPDTALAWGLHFDGSLTVSQAISAMDSLESRLTATNSAFNFVDGDVNLAFSSNVTGNVLQFILDGNAQAGWSSTLSDGSFLKVGESAFAEGYDSLPFYGEYYPMGVVWTTPVHPVSAPGVTPTAVDATIAASDIVYWVGEGENQMIFVVNWADTSLAWGYKFATETVSLQTVMDDIQTADGRFSYTGEGFVSDIMFNDGTVSLSGTSYWDQKINGQYGVGIMETIHNGDLNLWADPAAGVKIDSMEYEGYWYYSYAYPQTITPVSKYFPNVSDATIAASDILYWVGEGENQMRFVVNWADTSLAWGYKFATETVGMTTVMDAIKTADSRFDYALDDYGYLADITFNDGTVSLAVTPGNYFEQHLNGVSGYGMGETFHNGDLNLWADPAAGVQVGEVDYGEFGIFPIYAYPMTITPVSAPADPQPQGIDEVANINVKVYPNPASSVLNVMCGSMEGDAVIYDMTGRKVYSQAINGESMTINTSVLANGVYMLHIGNTTTKVVVRH